MPYKDLDVLIGGLTHIPIIILILRFIESKFKRNAIYFQKKLEEF